MVIVQTDGEFIRELEGLGEEDCGRPNLSN
jgi:hypothetical protein